MHPRLAGAIVFGTSAGILIIEIVAARLLAPYFGTSLETFTAIIGVILGAIATGTWIGGRLADRLDPSRLIGWELAWGGLLTLAIVPLVRVAGPAFQILGGVGLVVLVAATLFLPAAILSGVTPAVVKLVLRDLGMTGRVVGRLSALGTFGALLGTFLSGFVLVRLLPSSVIVGSLGALFAISGLAWMATVRERILPLALLGLGVGALALLLPGPCDLETRYACVSIEADPTNPDGRLLVLDTAHNSYVDLSDPTHLEFTYTRMFAAAIEAHFEGPLTALHIGGGGFTMPRWIEATHPGSSSLVLELDPDLIRLAQERLGLELGPDLVAIAGDARLALDELEEGSFDVAIGDAFSGFTVPWHLTTLEAIRSIEQALSPTGLYLMNVIDHGELEFLAAETRTMSAVFPHIAVISVPPRFTDGGNFVIVGSKRPLDLPAMRRAAAELGLDLAFLVGDELAAFVGQGRLLTDDFAPVDQLRS